jgi:hypothetical protein
MPIKKRASVNRRRRYLEAAAVLSGRLYSSDINAGQLFHFFKLSFTAYTIACDGPDLQPFKGYLFLTLLTKTVYPVFYILQGLLNPSHMQFITAAKMVGELSLRHPRGLIKKIR